MSISAAAIRAGKAFFQLGLDKQQFDHGLKGAIKGVQGLATSMATMGAQLAAAGLAIIMPLKRSVDVFADFERAMARTHALTDATDQQFSRLSDKARQLGRDTVFMATDAANAMSFFALAGFKVDEIMNVVGPTLDLAATGMMDVASAADIIAKVMRGMQIDTAKTAYVVDVMAKAMTTANTDLFQLGDAMKFVGPVANAAGISIEEITAAIMALSNAGLQGQMAGTALRGMITTLVKGTGAKAEELRAMGVQVLDASGKMKSLVEITAEFNNALGGLEKGAQLQALSKIFGKRELAGAAVLMATGAENLAAMEDSLHRTGTSARVSSMQLNTVWGAMKLIGSSVEGVAIEIGQALMPMIRALTAKAVDWLNAAAQRVNEYPIIVASVAALGAALAGAGTALVTVGIAITGLMSVGSSLATAVGTAWALSWNHWVMAIGKAIVILREFPAVESAIEAFFTSVARRASSAAYTIQTSWQSAATAIAAGDLQLAGDIAFTGLATAFLENTEDMRHGWADFVAALQAIWTTLEIPITAFFKDIGTKLANMMKAVDYLREKTGAKAVAEGGWNWLTGGKWPILENSRDTQWKNDLHKALMGQKAALEQEHIGISGAAGESRAKLEALKAEADAKKRVADAEAEKRRALDEQAKAAARGRAETIKERLRQMLHGGAPEAMAAVAKQIEAGGTFGGQLARQMGPGSFLEKLHDKASKQVDLLQDIKEEIAGLDGLGFE